METSRQFVVAPRLSTVGRTPKLERAFNLITKSVVVSHEKRHHESGPAVVEMSYADARNAVKEYSDDVIVTPLVKYDLALPTTFPAHTRRIRSLKLAVDLQRGQPTKKIKFQIQGPNGEAIPDVMIVAFFSFRFKWGASGTTDQAGNAVIDIPSNNSPNVFEVVYFYAPHSYWSERRLAVPVSDQVIMLQHLPEISGIQWWGNIVKASDAHAEDNRGRGIKVAVIDTGIGPHADIDSKLRDGENFTIDGSASNFRDVDGHGTHVAGIVCADGKLVGIAPSVDLYAARVFPRNGDGANNSDIAEAIQRAVDVWGCDVINMSLGGPYDPLTEDRINYATEKGVLCVVAAGNSEGSIEYPGALKNSFCVTAIGQLGRYPDNSIHKESEPPTGGLYGRNNLFAAEFTCRGPEADICAPGVAIISSVPVNKYASLDGTSMACPVITGVSSLVLEKDAQLTSGPRTNQRVSLLRSRVDSFLEDIRLPASIQGKGFASAV
jgi:hypothetical protein